MIRLFASIFILFFVLTAQAQPSQDSAKSPRPMGWKDISSWRSISTFNVNLSNDGQWVAYPLHTREGDGELMVKKVNDTVLRKYPIGGASFASYSFSEDGKWLAYKEASSYKEIQDAAKTPGKQLYDKLFLVELASGKKTEFERATSFSFNNKMSSHLAINTAKEKPGPGGSDILIVELATGKVQNIGNAGEHAFNKAGDHLAYAVDAANKSGNGIYLRHVVSQQTNVLDNDKALYRSIVWTEEGDAFALLKLLEDKAYKTEKGVVIGVKNIGKGNTVAIYDPSKDSIHFSKENTISKNRRPYWAEDRNRIFFGIAPLELVKKEEKKDADSTKKEAVSPQTEEAKLEKIKSDTSIKSIGDLKKALAKLDTEKAKPAAAPAKNDAKKPDMVIWHWEDKRLQSRQRIMENSDKNFSYIGLYDVATNKYIQVNDSSSRSLTIFPKQQYAIASDERDYELDMNLDGQSYTDAYIVDLKTGSKTLFEKKFYLPSFYSRPQPSPDGVSFLYGKDGHYYVYNIAAKTNINVTANVPTSFIDTEDDHNVEKPLTAVIGWSSDSKSILIRDLWDIWWVSANGKGAAVNLTQNGAATKTRYGRYVLDYEEKGIDLKKTLYVSLYGDRNKKSGIGKLEPGKNGIKPGVQQLIWDDVRVSSFRKAKNAGVFLYAKEKYNQPTEFFAGTEQLASAKQVTENAPDKNKYVWSSGVQLVDYVSDKGDSLQGALFLPAGYEKGKKYPTVIYYYEKMSQSLHGYSNPDFPGGGWNPTIYTSNGYAVFMPDIVYKMDDPGMSAVWCVLPGVKAAIKTGVIDENKMGLQGHSWGGYQTAFLVTQTNMFKAAAPGAPLTNMISMYDLIYWNSGGGNMSIFEASQGRFKGAPWENWESYQRNSPIYHVKNVKTPILLLHNDKDGAVDFTQGIEFYNALRRLKKPIVMITYNGENHGIVKLENRKDYAVRMMEFFDHHLKGAASPDWLKEGIDKLKLEEHLEKRAF